MHIPSEQAMLHCSACGETFRGTLTLCPKDGLPLSSWRMVSIDSIRPQPSKCKHSYRPKSTTCYVCKGELTGATLRRARRTYEVTFADTPLALPRRALLLPINLAAFFLRVVGTLAAATVFAPTLFNAHQTWLEAFGYSQVGLPS